MEFSFTNHVENAMVKSLLKNHGVSKKLLASVKFDGGKILVNDVEQNAIFRLKINDIVKIIVPDEPDNPFLLADDEPIDVVFEDEHYLIVNKPAGKPSITGSLHPHGAMSNLVKGYIQRQKYPNQTVHLITRLDRDTSGLIFFSKHSYAHAVIVHPKFKDSLVKRYFALVKSDGNLPEIGEIDQPIGRREGSIIERMVREDGKPAKTSYQSVLTKNDLNLLDVTLHTGRTHQIRVHFSHLGYPLIGDDLYGGDHELMNRQALHCHHLEFIHPFTNEKVEIELDLPEDMKNLLK